MISNRVKEKVIKDYWAKKKEELFLGLYHLPITILWLLSLLVPSVLVFESIRNREFTDTLILGNMLLASFGTIGIWGLWEWGIYWLKKGWKLRGKI